jgi:hypothetical protein
MLPPNEGKSNLGSLIDVEAVQLQDVPVDDEEEKMICAFIG